MIVAQDMQMFGGRRRVVQYVLAHIVQINRYPIKKFFVLMKDGTNFNTE